MNTPHSATVIVHPAAARAAAANVNRAATSAFRQTFGFAVTFAGVATLAAEAIARLNGA